MKKTAAAALMIALIDIVLKIIARQAPALVGSFLLETPWGVIGLTPSVNKILAFSLPIPNAIIWPMGWLVILALVRLFRRHPDASRLRQAIFLILAGALPNLIDRTFFGGVTDYLAFTNLFPAFNLADLLIIGGVVYWFWKTPKPR